MQESKISNIEWGLLMGAGFVLDLGQWALILLGIGLLIDEFVDMFVAMSLALYLTIRGEMDMKRAGALILGWLGEAGSDGALPLWGLEIISLMLLSKRAKILGQIPGGKVVESVVGKTK